MYFSIDRIVKGKATLIGEDKKPLVVSQSLLPAGSKSGDVLLYKNGKFVNDTEKTLQRRQRMGEMLTTLLYTKEEEEK